jgi:hypothetical protein
MSASTSAAAATTTTTTTTQLCPTCRDEPGTIKHNNAPGVRFCTLECMMQHFESQQPNSIVDDAYKARWAAEKKAGKEEDKASR